jgi:hypothetical protein
MVAPDSKKQMTISDAKNSVVEPPREKERKKKGKRLGVSRTGPRSRR